jgi:hypothetical protein
MKRIPLITAATAVLDGGSGDLAISIAPGQPDEPNDAITLNRVFEQKTDWRAPSGASPGELYRHPSHASAGGTRRRCELRPSGRLRRARSSGCARIARLAGVCRSAGSKR